MAKSIFIGGQKFNHDTGCRLLKAKFKECPDPSLEDFWEDIQPITFREIVTSFKNLEQRRVAIGCLGMEKIVSEVNPKLIDKKTISKKTTWVNQKGKLVRKTFKDTYQLYMINSTVWAPIGIRNRLTFENVYYVKFKDTSTDREYMLWVDPVSVHQTNNPKSRSKKTDQAIQAIAWSIQTDIEPGGIEKIVRQGDCILIKKKPNAKIGKPRHLTEKEYRNLIELES